ncbi:MAG TPA: DedA family protein [Solirubrobacteraceae bacterium]|nr:DedA family protein [Solirubrobacteraceae bacterium]
MLALAALISVSGGLGYALPAIVGLESMGVPSPGETALVLAAVLASEGKLKIWLVIVIAAGSAIVGDNIGYWLGRLIGREVLEAPGPFQKRRKRLIAIGQRFFDKHGGKAVFLARWIALVRIAAAWFAGIEEMNFLEFLVWNAAGGITWATAYGLVGFYGGKGAADAITHYGVIAAIALGVLIVAGLVAMKIRERRGSRSSEGEAAGQADPEPPSSPS